MIYRTKMKMTKAAAPIHPPPGAIYAAALRLPGKCTLSDVRTYLAVTPMVTIFSALSLIRKPGVTSADTSNLGSSREKQEATQLLNNVSGQVR